MSKSSELDKKVKSYIMDHIDPEPYTDKAMESNKDKLQFLYKTFKSEYGHEITRQRGNEINAFREWIMGLPTIFTVDFTNYDIVQLAIKWGSLPENHTEAQAYRIINNWFNLVANKSFQLFRKHGVIA